MPSKPPSATAPATSRRAACFRSKAVSFSAAWPPGERGTAGGKACDATAPGVVVLSVIMVEFLGAGVEQDDLRLASPLLKLVLARRRGCVYGDLGRLEERVQGVLADPDRSPARSDPN